MQINKLWNFALNELNKKNSICLIVMVHAKGHGPNRPGAKLFVSTSGNREGTVGGGIAERTLINEAKKILGEKNSLSKVITMSHKDSDNNSSGMICSGTQTFIIFKITSADINVIKNINTVLINKKTGSITIDNNHITFKPETKISDDIMWNISDNKWQYQENTGQKNCVYIIGGGHVSLALSQVLSLLEFEIVVLDNRTNLDTMQLNNYAVKHDSVDYNNIREYIIPGKYSYACIMTYGHKFDELILTQLIEYPLAYLGMMGSIEKIAAIKKNLVRKGIPETALNSLYAPIGIPIQSNTPEEIAISISAQLIKIKNSCS